MKANYGNNYSKLTRKEIAKNEEKLRDIVYAYFHKPGVFRRIVEGEEILRLLPERVRKTF